MLNTVMGMVLVAWGYLDGIKYHLNAQKIKLHKSAKGHSRRFILLALGNDLFRLYYFFFIDRNYYVLATAIIALIFMFEVFWYQYLYYPYRMRGCVNFKRPNIIIYIINSLTPNIKRKKL
jgi:hypothetical protein